MWAALVSAIPTTDRAAIPVSARSRRVAAVAAGAQSRGSCSAHSGLGACVTYPARATRTTSPASVTRQTLHSLVPRSTPRT
jgi:hypothetical protein